jgi:hypothetical protein
MIILKIVKKSKVMVAQLGGEAGLEVTSVGKSELVPNVILQGTADVGFQASYETFPPILHVSLNQIRKRG